MARPRSEKKSELAAPAANKVLQLSFSSRETSARACSLVPWGGSLLWAQRSVAQQKSLDRPIVRAIRGGGTREPAAAVV
jgi:hypothetical protein